MKKCLIVLMTLLMLVITTGCTEKDPEPEKEYVTVTFIGSCAEKSITVEKGSKLGNIDDLGLELPTLENSEIYLEVNLYDSKTNEKVDFETVINEDTVIVVEAIVWANAIPVDPDSDYVDVTSIDVPNCKYELNGTRYRAILKPGNSFQMDGVVYPENASDKTIKYKIDNDNGVVSLSETGLITANKYGSTMVRATACNGDNIGILVLVVGYKLEIEIPNQEDVYYLCDTIDYELFGMEYGLYENTEIFELPDGTKMEIVSGGNWLSFDPTTKVVSVSGNPDSKQDVTFRFVFTDEYGTDYSNEITVTVDKTVN